MTFLFKFVETFFSVVNRKSLLSRKYDIIQQQNLKILISPLTFVFVAQKVCFNNPTFYIENVKNMTKTMGPSTSS